MKQHRPWFARSQRAWRVGIATLGVALATWSRGAAPDAADVQRELLAGNYAFVIDHATAALRDPSANSEWVLLLVQAQLAIGRNADASAVMREVLGREPASLRLLWLARDVALTNGRPDDAANFVDQIRRYFTSRQWLY